MMADLRAAEWFQGWRRERVVVAVFLIGQALLLAVGLLMVAMSEPPALPLFPWLLAAATFYLAGHLLRVARLALLTGDASLSLRLLATLHFWTATISLIIPFKLGDGVRVLALAGVKRSYSSALALVWLERVFDAAVFVPLMIAAAVFAPAVLSDYVGLLLITGAFVLGTVGLMVLAPDNLRRIGTYVFRRYDNPSTVLVLRLIAVTRDFLSHIIDRVGGRVALLLAYSVFIWAAEVFALWLVLRALSTRLEPVSTLLTFISSVAEGRTLPASVTGLGTDVTYVFATQVPLFLCGLIASWYFGRWSLRWSKG